MKKFFMTLFSMCLLTFVSVPCFGDGDDLDNIPLVSERIKSGGLGNPIPKAPIQAPSASLSGYTFYINNSHPDYVLQIVDVDDETVIYYETDMLEDTDSAILPSTLSGQYVVQLLWGDWRFWGYIYLN